MSSLAADARGLSKPTPRSLAAGVARVYDASPVLVVAAVLFFCGAVTAAGLSLFDGRTLFGVSVWAKPAKFFTSLAVHSFTMAWALTLAEPAVRRARGVKIASAVFAGSGALEMVYIVVQAARGLASHFNNDAPLYSALYALMGIGAVAMLVATGYLGARILRRPAADARPVLARAAGLGLLTAAVLGGVMGAYMSAQRGHWVGGPRSDAGGLPVTGWATGGGDLRVPHFFGLHAMQVIAAVGWLAGNLPARRGNRVVSAAALAWSALTVALFVQAVLGRPFLPI
jgi:hypothetical protein